jgi:tetratricopeptide (TPR) repeat protein
MQPSLTHSQVEQALSDSPRVRSELLRRRVPQIVGAYFAGGWIAVEFTDWAVGHWILSPHITDFVALTWLFLLPAVALLAWTHGAPGRDRWTRLETSGVGLNLLVGAVAMWVLFHSRDLGSATSPVTVLDEDGQSLERRIPDREFTRRMALFAFRNETEATELDWLQIGVPWSLALDLEQDDWLRPVAGFGEELNTEPFSPAHLPLSRQRELARDRFLDYLITGTIRGRPDSVVLVSRLYEAATGALLEEREFHGSQPLDVVDLVSRRVREDLELPSGHLAATPDLPVRELLSDSLVAVRAFLQAEFLEGRDAAANLRLLAAAVGTDSTFALAQAALGEAYLAANRPEEAYAAYEAAIRHDYRLSERSRFEVKVRYYQITRQPEKTLAIARMRTQLYPTDPAAWDVLGIVHLNQGDFGDAVEAFRAALQIDPSSWGRVQLLARSYRSAGRGEEAERAFERYAERYPERLAPIRAIGELHLEQGDFTGAAEQFERALLVDPADFPSLVALADLAERTGEFEAARGYYDRAVSASRTPDQMWLVGGRLVAFFDLQGMTDSAIARMEALAGYVRSSQGRLTELRERVHAIALYPRAGRAGRAEAFLDTLRAELEPPLDLFVPLGEAFLARELGDGRRVEAALPDARRLYREFGFGSLNWIIRQLEGEALRLQGRCEESIPLYEEAAATMPAGQISEADVALGGGPWLALGRCYRQTGQLDRAAVALGESYSRVPADARVLYELALLYADMGERREGLRYLNGAVHVWRNADAGNSAAERARELLADWQSPP